MIHDEEQEPPRHIYTGRRDELLPLADWLMQIGVQFTIRQAYRKKYHELLAHIAPEQLRGAPITIEDKLVPPSLAKKPSKRAEAVRRLQA